MVKKMRFLKDKVKIKKVIAFLLFIALAWFVFCKVTYLFRNADYNREHIQGIKKEDNLDMVFVGASSTLVYWQPMTAWENTGFTSYAYATTSAFGEEMQAYIEEVRRSREPYLFVVDARTLLLTNDELGEAGLRNATDSVDITSPVRYKLLNKVLKSRNTEDADILSYYIDIASYHSNTQKLATQAAWDMMDNDIDTPYKGWEFVDWYNYYEEPDNQTDARAPLSELSNNILTDLLDYCDDENLNVLFVVSPYFYTSDECEQYNTMSDMVTERGYSFINTNDYYDEMNLDFSKDFYEGHHVNLFGAEKYTSFLADYIVDNYDMPDHRGDSSYSFWDELATSWDAEFEVHAARVTEQQLSVEKGLEIEEQLKATDNFAEWYELATDDRYDLIVASAGGIETITDEASRQLLEKWDIGEAYHAVRWIENGEIKDTNSGTGELELSGNISLPGHWKTANYFASIYDGRNLIKMDDETVLDADNDLCVVVYDNNYGRVVDAVKIDIVDGKAVMSR